MKKQKEVTKWSVDSFLENNRIDLLEITPSHLSQIISIQPNDRKIQLLSDERIKNYYKDILLNSNISYDLYENLFLDIDIFYMREIFDYDFIQKFFSRNTGHEYKLLVSFFQTTKQPNLMMEFILNRSDIFNHFKKEFTNFYSVASSLDYHHLKLLIDRIVRTNSYDCFSMLPISIEYEEQLLKEEFPVETLLWLIERMSIEAISDFFENNARAELVIPYFEHNQINKYMGSGVKFGNKIIRNKDFFELLKCESLITFRERINYIEDHCDNPHFIEEQRVKYYEYLLNCYNPETGLFLIYEEILNHPNIAYEKLKENKDEYIISTEIMHLCRGDKNQYLNITSQKLSEIIIDALFQDNIYNTWINIKELLRFESHLSKKEKTLDKEKLDFYNLILNIDSYPNNKKIELYHKLKDKKIHLMFYEDLRKSKDLAYKKIKESLINPIAHKEFINQEETDKYHVPVYDLRNTEFYMLVRTIGGVFAENSARMAGSSYSLISHNNTDVFDLTYNRVIYGYNSFDIDKVLHMFEFDSFSTSHISSMGTTENITNRPNRIATKEEIADSPGYSEIVLKNKHNFYQFDEMKPDFIVVIDKVDDRSLYVSSLLEIPIVIIPQTKINKNVNYLTDHTEGYTQGSLYESERIGKR